MNTSAFMASGSRPPQERDARRARSHLSQRIHAHKPWRTKFIIPSPGRKGHHDPAPPPAPPGVHRPWMAGCLSTVLYAFSGDGVPALDRADLDRQTLYAPDPYDLDAK